VLVRQDGMQVLRHSMRHVFGVGRDDESTRHPEALGTLVPSLEGRRPPNCSTRVLPRYAGSSFEGGLRRRLRMAASVCVGA
jgi:hypothetical protein